MQNIRLNAYAKINAYLAVTGRREDGYHTILSHMQAVTLYDELSLAYEPASGEPFTVCLTTSDPRLSCDGTNLVSRAATALAHAALKRGVEVSGKLIAHVQKNIPMAAGLAGGSADAAATLRGMNGLLGHPFTTEELCRIGTTLGADIPFCVRSEQSCAMTARGIGDILTDAPGLPADVWLVIACHGEGVSTPWAYRALDEHGLADEREAGRRYAEYLAALEQGDIDALAACAYNCFEGVVIPERGAVSMLMREMIGQGARFARMSGSGPSVVGFFEREAQAEACRQALCDSGVQAHVCRPLKI